MTNSEQVLIIIDVLKIIVLMSILLFTLNPVEDKCVSNVLIVMIMSQARFVIYFPLAGGDQAWPQEVTRPQRYVSSLFKVFSRPTL